MQISPQDWQDLSAYLDQQLDERSQRNLEARLQGEPDLREALEEVRRVRLVLRSAPRLRAPRNFTLTEQMAGVRRRPQAYPILRLAAVLASILFLVVLVGDLIGGSGAPTAMMQLEAGESAQVEQPAKALMQESAPPVEEALPAAKSAPDEPSRKAAPTPTAEALALEAAPAASALSAPAPAGTAYPEADSALTAMLQATETPQVQPTELVSDQVQAPEESPRITPGVNDGLLRGIEIGLAIVALAAWLAFLILRRPSSGGN